MFLWWTNGGKESYQGQGNSWGVSAVFRLWPYLLGMDEW